MALAWRALTSINVGNRLAYTAGDIVPDANVALYHYDAKGLVERVDLPSSLPRPDGLDLVTQAEFDAGLQARAAALGFATSADISAAVANRATKDEVTAAVNGATFSATDSVARKDAADAKTLAAQAASSSDTAVGRVADLLDGGIVRADKLPDLSAAYRTVAVAEGRYRRVLSEVRSLSAGADIAAIVNTNLAAAGGYGAAELRLPEGDYTLSTAALRASVAGTRLVGAGSGKTRLTVVGNRDAILAGGAGATDQPSGIVIEGFTIVGDAASGNQRGVRVEYATAPVIRDVVVQNAGNNGVNLYYCAGGRIDNVEVSGSRDFGILVYQSTDVRILDPYIHDLTVASRAHVGIQFKSCQRGKIVRPRMSRIAGYGLYTWQDLLPWYDGTATRLDEDHDFIDADISDLLTGGSFSATSIYINESSGVAVRGGRLRNTPGSHLSIVNAPRTRLSGIRKITGANAAPAISISGTSHGVTINDVHGYGNLQGIVVNGAQRGRILGSSMTDGVAGASNLAAALRMQAGAAGWYVADSDFSDYQATPTQKRGIYEEAGGPNIYSRCVATGNTVGDVALQAGSQNLGIKTTTVAMV